MQNFYYFYFPLEKKYIKFNFKLPKFYYLEKKIKKSILKLLISPPESVVNKLIEELNQKK